MSPRPWRGLGEVFRRWPILVVAFAVVVLTWGRPESLPRSGLDPSWTGGLAMAVDRGLQFGPDIVFPYGPLSFLAHEGIYVGWMASTSVLFGIVLQLALVTLLLWALARLLPFWAAVLALIPTVIVMQILTVSQQLLAAVAVASIAMIGGSLSPRVMGALVPILGVVAGIGFMFKANDGVAIVVVCAVAAWFASGWRSEATLLATFAASAAAIWLLTGQDPSSFPTWVARSTEMVSAYSANISLQPSSGYEYLVVPVVAIFLIVGWWRSTASLPKRQSLAILGVTGFVAFMLLKNGVRYQYAGYAVMAIVLATALTWRREAWRSALAVLVSLTVVAGVLLADRLPQMLPEPVESARLFGSTVHHYSSVDKRDGLQDYARRRLRDQYALEASTLRAIGDHPVHFDPWEVNISWAFPELEWNPVPVFQSFSAYSDELDSINAAALRSQDGPDRILRMDPVASKAGGLSVTGSVEDRNPDFESPAYVVAMMCNFAEIHSTDRWQVLGRVPDRCGEPEEIGRATVSMDETVVVPPVAEPGFIVVAEISGLLDLPRRVQATLLKGGEYWMQADGDRSWRVVPSTASNGLLMAAPGEALGYTERFGFAGEIQSFSIEPRFWIRTSPVTVTFVRIPLRPVEG